MEKTRCQRLLRGVLFDLGDTLVHVDRPWDEVFTDQLKAAYGYLKRQGFAAGFDDFATAFTRVFNDANALCSSEHIEIPTQELFESTLRKLNFHPNEPRFLDGIERNYYGPQLESWQTFPDTSQVLATLTKKGFELGLVSNTKSRWMVLEILGKHNLTDFFRVIVTSDALRARKPKPEIFLKALDAMKLLPVDTVFVGDTFGEDIVGAKSLGMRAIHVVRGPNTIVDGSAKSDAVVGGLTEAANHILTWNGTPIQEQSEPSASQPRSVA